MTLADDLSVYNRANEPDDDDDDTTGAYAVAIDRAISLYEIKKLGLESSRLLYPRDHVEARVDMTGDKPKVLFASRILIPVDQDGSIVPVVTNVLYFSQNWDPGGFYLDPDSGIEPTEL